jgi:hypothetical protein
VGSHVAGAGPRRGGSSSSLFRRFPDGNIRKGLKDIPEGNVDSVLGCRFRNQAIEGTFRSSTNAKVICELVSSTDVRNGGFSLGSRLTVVGKVRGRGILGNVTLDECSLAPSLFAGNEPRPVAAEPAHEEPKEPEHHAEEPIGQPVEIPIAEAPTADAPTRPVSTRPTSPVRSVLPTKTVANTVPPTERPSSQPAQPLPATSECEPRSSASARLPSALHAFAGLLVGFGAHFMLVRFRPRRAYAIRPSAGGVTTEEARRAALEALLLGQKKKNS